MTKISGSAPDGCDAISVDKGGTSPQIVGHGHNDDQEGVVGCLQGACESFFLFFLFSMPAGVRRKMGREEDMAEISRFSFSKSGG